MPTKEEMHNLGQGIIASFEARTAGIASMREEVREQLGELDRNHQAMARRQRTDLARGRADLKANVNAQLHDLGQGHAALTVQEGRRKVEVNTWLHEVDQAHQAMGRQLRADLAHGRADLQQQVGELRSDLKRGCSSLSRTEARRKGEVHAWMGQVAAEHAGARQEWHRLVHTMAGKRNSAPAGAGPAVEEEHAVARAVVGAVTEELTALGDRVFQFLANHPDGARLTEIEREFGLGRLQAGRVVRHLMDEGKAEKRDLSYFAT